MYDDIGDPGDIFLDRVFDLFADRVGAVHMHVAGNGDAHIHVNIVLPAPRSYPPAAFYAGDTHRNVRQPPFVDICRAVAQDKGTLPDDVPARMGDEQRDEDSNDRVDHRKPEFCPRERSDDR